MSFILDAIKRSESERQKAREPDVYSLQNESMDQRKSTTSSGLRVILFFVSLLLILAIGWWLWPGLVEQFGQFRANTTPASEDNFKALTQPVKNKPTTMLDANNNEHTLTGDSELPPRHLIKELWELPADFQAQIPTLAFSFHVYSKDPTKRTIIINDRRLKEGQMVASHLKLKMITSTGIILFHKDRFFHVDVVEEW